MAVLAGSEYRVRAFEQRSQTRVHCSPPSAAVLFAAAHALALNRTQGEGRRRRLFRLVVHFRTALAEVGLLAHGRLFPMQRLGSLDGPGARALHRRLLHAGVRTALLRARGGHGAELGFVLNARQHTQDLDYAARALARATDPSLFPARRTLPCPSSK